MNRRIQRVMTMTRLWRCIVLLVMIMFSVQSIKAQVQQKRFSEGQLEFDFATKPFKRHLFEVDIFQGTKADTGKSNFLKYPAYSSIYLWYHYYPTRTMKVSAGFYCSRSYDIEEIAQASVNEYRFSAIGLYNVPARRLYLSHRFALDFRWRYYEDSDTYRTRFRYRLKAIIPINKRELVKGTVFLSASEELFFSKVNNTYRNQILEQSQTAMGIGYCITDNIQLEPGVTFALLPLFGSSSYTVGAIYSIRFAVNNLFINQFKPKK